MKPHPEVNLYEGSFEATEPGTYGVYGEERETNTFTLPPAINYPDGASVHMTTLSEWPVTVLPEIGLLPGDGAQYLFTVYNIDNKLTWVRSTF